MLLFSELRKLLEKYPKYHDCQIIHEASVANDGFPGKFNYSFWESELDREVGKNYLEPVADLIHWKIQPCVRHKDFFDKILCHENSYLSLFEMGAISGAIQKLNTSDEEKAIIVKFTVKSMADFLINVLCLEKEKICVSVFSGGAISEITQGKYNFKKELKMDNLTYNGWIEAGIDEKNIILDKSRNTLLALKLDRPCWWGFRNEILYKKGEEFIDIGTVEWLDMEPIFEKGEITGTKQWPNLIAFNLIGLERILFVKNNFKHIRECDHIFPLYLEILDRSKFKKEHEVFIVSECLRTLHRIFTDSGGYKNLSKKRKEIVRKYFKILVENCRNVELELSFRNLSDLLRVNTTLQSFHPEFLNSVALTSDEIIEHIKY